MSKKMHISEENGHLVSLAVALSRKDVSEKLGIKLGIPSPGEAGTPGTYFGAMAVLKFLVSSGDLTPERVAFLLKSNGLRDFSRIEDEVS